jgi:hypothetical protein
MTEERSSADIAREHEERERQEAQEERQRADQEEEEARQAVEALEEDPPKDLEEWPGGKAKYETFGGPEHETSYEEAATSKLGPPDVRHLEDGSVEVAGKKVENPEEFKGEPIPGGPTDPKAKGVIKDREEKKKELEEEGGEA